MQAGRPRAHRTLPRVSLLVDARRLTSWGTDVISNCAILCADCQKAPQPVRGTIREHREYISSDIGKKGMSSLTSKSSIELKRRNVDGIGSRLGDVCVHPIVRPEHRRVG